MKALIVKLSSMGDLICTLPALTDAKRAIAEISFDWVAEENFSEIPSWHSTVDMVMPIALRRWRKQLFHRGTILEIRDFLKKLSSQKYDYIIDAQGLIKSAIVAKIAHGTSYGFSTNNAREPLATYFYQNKLDISKKLHMVERIRQLFAATLGYPIPTSFPEYNISQEKLGKQDNAPEKYLVFIHGTSRENKCWQIEKWIELSRLAKSADIKIKLPWGNETELARAKSIAATNDNVEVLPKLTLSEIGAILFKAKGVVAVDTGFSHLAAALSIPAITLYGPTDPKLGGVYGKNQTYLINMNNIEPQTVWQKIKLEFNLELKLG